MSASAHTPHGPYSTRATLSYAQRDAAKRAPLYARITEAFAEVRQLAAHFSEFGKTVDEVLRPAEHLTFLRRLNLLAYKLQRVRSFLSLHNFRHAQYYVLSTRHDLRAMRTVLEQAGASEFIDNYVAALAPVVRGYMTENKRYATIAIGCTGGKHRSVAVSKVIAERLSQMADVSVSVKHRDLGQE